MNLIAGTPWLTLFLAGALFAAALEDAVRLRISNWTCVAVILAAIVAMAMRGFPLELWQNAAVFALILALGTFAFAGGLLGGGDVKLLAALGLWVDFPGAAWLITAVFLAGGVLAIGFITSRPLRRHAVPEAGSKPRPGVPYGVAIAAGALFVFAAQLGMITPRSENQITLAP
jgi:prepilin peptidase CpaA